MKNRFIKKYGTFSNGMLIFLALVIGYYLINIFKDIDDTDYVIRVTETKAGIVSGLSTVYHLSDREVHSVLHVQAKSFLDYLLLEKHIDSNLFQLMLLLLILYQVFKINSNWYDKKFTKDLYAMIDTFSIMAIIMWMFSSLQEWHQNNILEKISKNGLELSGSRAFLHISIFLLIISRSVKGFAKHGSKLQEEQDLTI
jgi:hypothetical protein